MFALLKQWFTSATPDERQQLRPANILRWPSRSTFELKMRLAALSDEARYTKVQERRILKRYQKAKHRAAERKVTEPTWQDEKLFYSLRRTRTVALRREMRHSHLAYGCIHGRSYELMEQSCWIAPDWIRIENLVRQFSAGRDERIVAQRTAEWMDTAKEKISIKPQVPREKKIRANKKEAP